jgi:hypothetical protein
MYRNRPLETQKSGRLLVIRYWLFEGRCPFSEANIE